MPVLFTLSQTVKRQNASGRLVALWQTISRMNPAGAPVRLDQDVIYLPIDDWEVQQVPVERHVVYLLDVGNYRVPISSAQSTMRLNGQSFLQAVIPNAGAHIGEIAVRKNQSMSLRSGYRYADGSFSPLEEISTAPFQFLSQSTGAVNDTVTLSGYGVYRQITQGTRELRSVQTRTTDTEGKRRVRAKIDLFLRPGHTVRDSDGIEFLVGIIQYFINASSEAMEVIEDG